jgi:hypothetical protein
MNPEPLSAAYRQCNSYGPQNRSPRGNSACRIGSARANCHACINRVAVNSAQPPEQASECIPEYLPQAAYPADWLADFRDNRNNLMSTTGSTSEERRVSTVVDQAMLLYTANPAMTARQILDGAMLGASGNPDFFSYHELDNDFASTYVDELEPPSFLSELIRQAFAPQITSLDLCLIGLFSNVEHEKRPAHVNQLRESWDCAIESFAGHYRLWEGPGTVQLS